LIASLAGGFQRHLGVDPQGQCLFCFLAKR
jgi:hypothetical protein